MSHGSDQTVKRVRDTSEITTVPLLDICRENEPLSVEMLAAIARVFDSGQFVLGPEVQQLEKSIAKMCGTDFAIGCASCSDALLLALMSIGVQRGDEVIVPGFTFFATASAVWRLGAKPVFADIDSRTFNLDPNSVASCITPQTKAIIPVHLFGQCADMQALCEVARQHQLIVVEDAAQAVGSRDHGRPAGGLGDIACFSFYPTKNLGGCGDGGMLTTSREEFAQRLRLLRGHGMHPRYFHNEVGVNSRLDSLQAAILNVKLHQLPGWTRRRQENAMRYDKLFTEAGLDTTIVLPQTASGHEHVWNQYTIRVPDQLRDALRQHLSDAGIGTEIYYPVPLHRQACFQDLGYPQGSLPETERAAKQVLSLPIFPELTLHEQQTVVARMAEFFQAQTSGKGSARSRPDALKFPDSMKQSA